MLNIDSISAKKVVFGTGIAMAICCAVTTEVHINQVWKGEGGPPVFIPIIFGLLALWSFYVGLKKDSSNTQRKIYSFGIPALIKPSIKTSLMMVGATFS